MKNFRFILVFLSLLIINTATFTGCASKPLPPVFEGARLFNDHHFYKSPPVYRCITPGHQPHAYEEGWPFEVNLNTALPDAPDRLTAYKIIRPAVDEDYARSIAQRLGYNENTLESWDNSSYPHNGYRFYKGNKALVVYEDGTISIHDTDSLAKPYSLPTNQECIDIAQEWLESYDLYPGGVINVETSPIIVTVVQGYTIIDEYTAAISVNFKIGIDGYELHGMGAYISVGKGGQIIQVNINIPRFERYSTVRIQKPEVALSNFQDYLDNPQKFWADNPECLIDDLNPKMSIESVSLKYFCMLNDDITQPTYAQPVYVFEGQGYHEDDSEAYSFVGRVDAVSR